MAKQIFALIVVVICEENRMDDLISRQAAIDAINCDITITGRQNAELVAATIGAFVDRIKALPSVEPKRETTTLRIGRTRNSVTMWYECAECGEPVDQEDAFCRRCGRGIIHE